MHAFMSCIHNMYMFDSQPLYIFCVIIQLLYISKCLNISIENVSNLTTITVQPPIVDTPRKGHSIINLSTKDTYRCPK